MTANWGSAARLGTWKLEQRGQPAPAGRRAWTHWPAPRGQRALLDQISSKAAAQRQWFAARTPCDVARSGHRSRLRAAFSLRQGRARAAPRQRRRRCRTIAATSQAVCCCAVGDAGSRRAPLRVVLQRCAGGENPRAAVAGSQARIGSQGQQRARTGHQASQLSGDPCALRPWA